MNASADVLAVMDRCIEILHSNAWGEDREDLQEARAAVAELIEAADALVTAARVLAITNEPERWRDHVRTHSDIVAAALARVAGEGA